jgi:hypothetical protein
MANNILKEAIADAKAVREVALANAKAALEEAFTPRLQSMLSAKLSEELNEEEDLDENTEEIEETYMEDKEEIEENHMEDKEDLDEEIDLEEILSELELEEGEDSEEKTVDEAKDKDEETMDEAKDEDEIEEAVGKPNYRAEYVRDVMHKASDIHGGLYEGSEFDLDALLEEINNLEETEDEVEEGRLEQRKVRKEETNEVLGTAALGIAGIVAAAGGLTALENAAEDPEFKAKYPKVAKVLATLQDMGNAAADTKRMEETAKDEELAETQAALETVRTELNEVNLLNSKLLYVNRIFKANNLSEGQKLRVVETLDKAESVKEAKLIYETIKDTFNVANATQTTPKKSIRENFGMASKSAGLSTAPKKPILNESNDMVTRMQKLANIKINQ